MCCQSESSTMIVRNWQALTSHGNTSGREIVLRIIESAIEQVNSYRLVREQIKVARDLSVGALKYELGNIRKIFVIGAGKQVTFVASAVEDALQDRISDGIVVEKKGWGCKTNRIKVIEGGHPLPDETSVKGANEIVRMATNAEKNDLVIVCVTGGCSSLIMLPPDTITIREAGEVCRLLLNSGAPIEDVNAVRKHLSQVGGGKLAMLIHPAEVLSFIAVDEVAGVPWGPSVPDTTSFSDAKNVLMRYDLWSRISASVRDYFDRADPLQETPKAADFRRIGVREHHVVFADNSMLCRAVERKASDLGLRSMTISTSVEGEAKDAGIFLASIAKEVEKNERPFKPPVVIIAGGETTVTIPASHGEGGRNQELALAAAMKIAGSRRITLASVATDGTDGPTDIAGAIVDGYTMEQATEAGVDLVESLRLHNSSSVFRRLNDAVYTNDTGTNLMDLIIVYVS